MLHFISQLRRSRMSIESANRQYISRLQRSRTLRRLNRKLVADRCEKPMSHFISQLRRNHMFMEYAAHLRISRLRRSRMSIESTNHQYISRLRRSRILRRLNRNELQTGAKNRCRILSADSGGITCLWKTRLISGSADSGGVACL